MRSRLAVLTLVAILAAGCGGEEETTPGPAAATPPPTPTVAEIEPETETETEVEASTEIDPAALQLIVDALGERSAISSMTASVRSPGGSITTAGHAADGGTPGKSSQYLVGSVGKTMLAVTTLLLVEEGVLDLDEPIERWLPEFPRGDELTLRLLLSHRAGMARRDSMVDVEPGPAALVAYEQTMTPDELLTIAAVSVGDQPLPAAFEYSNPGFNLVGGVIEAATGRSLAEVMQTRIFDPLTMADTFLAWPEQVDRLVQGELAAAEGVVVKLPIEAVRGYASQAWAAGGQVSTTRDLATFYGAIFDGLLSPASVEAMKAPGSTAYGLGIEAMAWPGGRRGWGHAGGAAVGYTCAAGVTDDGWSAAVCTNRLEAAAALSLDPSEIWQIFGEVLTVIGPQG